MEGIVTFTIETNKISADQITRLNADVLALGLRTTLPQTEGGDMPLPAGTYGAVIEIGDQMEQVKLYYQSLVALMRKLKIEGKYFVNLSAGPTYVCGEL